MDRRHLEPGCAAARRSAPAAGRRPLDPDTPVLMADWTTRRIEDLREGDTVVAFDEGTAGVGLNKLYDTAVVERVWWSRKPAVRLTTDDGGSIVASTDHLFAKPPRGWFKAGNARVLQSRIRRIAAAPPADGFKDDYCAGYLAGATDGDGTMRERVEGKRSPRTAVVLAGRGDGPAGGVCCSAHRLRRPLRHSTRSKAVGWSGVRTVR